MSYAPVLEVWRGSIVEGIGFGATTALETLRQLRVVFPAQLFELASFDARVQYNWHGLQVGRYAPAFRLLEN